MKINSVFIAFTKNERFWDKSKDIVLLGSWCLNDLENQNTYKVLPHPIKLEESDFAKFDDYNEYLYRKYWLRRCYSFNY